MVAVVECQIPTETQSVPSEPVEMAATYQVSQLEPFNFTNPKKWPKWLQRCERQASGLTEKSEETQVNTLIYCMGDEADDVLRSFELSAEESKKHATVRDKFESHFVKRRNVIFKRAKFNNRKQQPEESVDAFITALYALAEHCNYGGLHDEMIRDRIVVGIRDSSLSEKLQLDAELTLTTAIAKVHQSEEVKKQQPLLRREAGRKKPDIPVGAVQGRKHSQRRSQQTSKHRKAAQLSGRSNQPQNTCTRCGKSPSHDRRYCPARDAICRKCSKKGHFQAVCHSTVRVGEIHREDQTDAFLGGVKTRVTPDNPWRLTLKLNDTPTDFQIDTGAEVTAISKASHEKISSPTLASLGKTLRGPSNYPLPVTGCFTGRLEQGGQEVQQEIFVVQNLRQQLLGHPAIEALGLAVRVGAIFDEETTPVQLFPQLFEGLEKLEGEYEIKLRPGSKPYALSVPRRVAVPLMGKVQEEPQRME